MTTRAVVIVAARLVVLAISIWLLSSLVALGLPLQWLAIFLGGILAISNAVAFLIEPLIMKAIPDLEARQRAIFGYSLSRRVVIAIRVVYIILGGAAVVWGVMTPL